MAYDPSSSLSKSLYSIDGGSLELMTMEPDVVKVPKGSLKALTEGNLGDTSPENHAWIGLEDAYYGIGFLARNQLYSFDTLKKLKYENGVLKVLAMIGAIAQRKRLSSRLTLNLGMLLPYGEYQDRVKLEQLLKKALSQFIFRGKTYNITLEFFNCLPEGAGVLFRGGDRSQKGSQKNLLVIMLGYRNISYLLMERGLLTKGETENLGLAWLINKVKQGTSGLKPRELVLPITQAGKTIKKSPLKSLLKSDSHQLRKEELEEIVKAVSQGRSQHIAIIEEWLQTRKFPRVTEVILAGGTANYYRPELENCFKEPTCHWADKLENQVKKLVGETRWSSEFAYRLTDIYGYYFYFQYIQRKIALGLAG